MAGNIIRTENIVNPGGAQMPKRSSKKIFRFPICEKLEELRWKNHLSYTEFGKRIGVNRQTATNYCTGKTKTIPSDVIDRICDAFGVSRYYLTSETFNPTVEFPLLYVAECTGLSQEAAANLIVGEAKFPLTYLLEKAPAEFWTVLNAYLTLASRPEKSYLEVDPFSMEFKKVMGDLDILEEFPEPGNEKFRISNQEILEQIFLSKITGSLQKLKANYWGWKLSRRDEDCMKGEETEE